MNYTVIITHFSLHPDGQWLTTGKYEVIDDLDRAGVERLIAERGGPGVQISIGPEETDVGGTELIAVVDDELAAERAAATLH